jgi:gliding motility-associated-like protein
LTGGCGVITTTGTISVAQDNTINLSSPAGTDGQILCINTPITNITYITTEATGAIVTGLPAGVTGSWSANVVTISGTPLDSGPFNYAVTLTGGCGVVTAGGDITVNNIPSLVITNPAEVCSPSTVDLTAGAVTAGSTPGLTYTYWTDALATTLYPTPAAASAGTYYIKGTDAVTGCFVIQPVTVKVNPIPTVTITDPAVCSPATADLTAAAVTAGSTPGLTYTYWTDVLATTPYATPATATADTYYIKGTDPLTGCYTIQPVTVTINASPTVATTHVNVACFGGATGTATAIASGGTGVYTYSWNTIPVQTTAVATGLAAGTYIVTVDDGNSCGGTASTIITEPATSLSGSITSQTNASVFGGNDGSVTVSGSDGTPPYQYKLGTGTFQASGTFGTLIAGSYTVTVVDINLCTFDVPVTITEPSPPLSGSIISQTNIACFGDSTGSVTVSGISGATPYEYSLDAGTFQSSATFAGLAAGTYTITVQDAALATFNINVTITQPLSALGGFIDSQKNVLCFGNNTGNVAIAGSGGVSPYLYNMTGGSYQASGLFEALKAGPYTVTIQDANLCTFDVTVNITQPLAALAASTLSSTNPSCFGSANGAVNMVGSGGTSPYMFSLNGGSYQASGSFSGLTATVYTISVQDANLCTASTSVTLTEPEALSVASSIVDASCPDSEDGSITLTITGGKLPYSTVWIDNVITQDRINISPGTYRVLVTDFNSCAASLDVVVGAGTSEKCLEIPTIITPNNDGFNDTWKIKNIDLFPNAEVFVYNRWGELVFRSKNLSLNQWNGTYKERILPTDSYHYILHLNDGSKPRSGVISIIR